MCLWAVCWIGVIAGFLFVCDVLDNIGPQTDAHTDTLLDNIGPQPQTDAHMDTLLLDNFGPGHTLGQFWASDRQDTHTHNTLLLFIPPDIGKTLPTLFLVFDHKRTLTIHG